jgi:hypothetical protein
MQTGTPLRKITIAFVGYRSGYIISGSSARFIVAFVEYRSGNFINGSCARLRSLAKASHPLIYVAGVEVIRYTNPLKIFPQ